MTRLFNKRQRYSRRLLAGGCCENCGCDLPDDFHMHHVKRWVDGGKTETSNALALCEQCHIDIHRSENKMKLRQWQIDGLQKLKSNYLEGKDSFIADVCPGGGKTLFAAYAAKWLFDNGICDLVITVSPSKKIRHQWHDEFNAVGFNVKETVDGAAFKSLRIDGISSGINGFAMTWSMLPDLAETITLLCENHKVLFIGDEIHHAGKDDNERLKWGEEIYHAFDSAKFKIGLSGTLFRSDNALIPFLDYSNKGSSEPDIVFDYSQALSREECNGDPVVRHAFFHKITGFVNVSSEMFGSESVKLDLLDESIDQDGRFMSMRLSRLLEFESGFIQEMLYEAHARLLDLRDRYNYPYGGLLLAKTQKEANKIAVWMAANLKDKNGLPIKPRMSTGIADADNTVLNAFTHSESHWLISIRKVAEGVDIPRLRVLVYASNITQRLFFMQALGRVIRLLKGIDYEDQSTAFIYIPEEFRVMEIVHSIQKSIQHITADLPPPPAPASIKTQGDTQGSESPVIKIDGGNGVKNGFVSWGNDYSDAELVEAKKTVFSTPWINNLSPEEKAEILRAQAEMVES